MERFEFINRLAGMLPIGEERHDCWHINCRETGTIPVGEDHLGDTAYLCPEHWAQREKDYREGCWRNDHVADLEIATKPHTCEMLVHTNVNGYCDYSCIREYGKPASLKSDGCWFCEEHSND